MTTKVLSIENLLFGYKFPLTSEPVNITANCGDFICFIGRNGTGKTTMLNTIIGVKKALSGTISICGVELNKISNSKKSQYVSFVPSKIEAIQNMRVRDLVAVGRTPYTNIFDRRTQSDNAIISEAIEQFGLGNIANSQISEISDGERQKAMICRAVVQKTPTIILDEPTAFLDYFAKQKLLADLKELAEKENKCIIFSCHDLDIALKYCTHIWLLDDNKLTSLSKEEFLALDYFSKYQK
ncbi:MAG: ABC transporter ATP-binding protein [Bacteroidales bacterium]|nr:ABC transporter ATP-binding protein [Bacteroidales bacterium]